MRESKKYSVQVPESITCFQISLFCTTFLEEVHVAKDNGILGDDVISRTI